MSGELGVTLAELLAKDAGVFLDLLADRLGVVVTDEGDNDGPRWYSVAEVAEVSSLSRWSIHEAIRRGDLDSVKNGSRRLIPAEALNAWLADRPATGEAS